MSKITLSFNNDSIELTSDAEGRFSLNAIHRVSKTTSTKAPNRWTRNQDVADLVEKYQKPNLASALVTNNGGRPETRGVWAIREIVFAYAEWISPDFHKAVIDSFTAAVDGDSKGAVKKAQSVVRIDGVQKRKSFAASVFGQCPRGSEISTCTNIIYVGLFNKDATSLKAEYGTGKKTARVAMEDEELAAIAAAESLATLRILKEKANPDRRMNFWRDAAHLAAQDVKQIIG